MNQPDPVGSGGARRSGVAAPWIPPASHVRRLLGFLRCWVLLATLLLLSAERAAPAATINWVGPTVGTHLWSAPSNWEGGKLPTAQDDVRISGEVTNLIVVVTGNFGVRGIDSTCALRIVSDIGANSVLNVAGVFLNRGILRLECSVPARTSTLILANGGSLDNRGLIWAVAQNEGSRRINGPIANRGRILVEKGITLNVGNRDQTFSLLEGRIDGQGSFVVEEGRVDFTGGAVNGDVRLINGTIAVASTVTQPSLWRLLGPSSRLVANASPVVTLWADTDVGNNTTLATLPAAFNDGRIVLGSARTDRTSHFDASNVFTNRPGGVVEAFLDGGGGRSLSGTLVNQGLLLCTNTTITVSGTYQPDGGRAVGEIRFQDARIIPTRAAEVPNQLQLFGANSVLEKGVPTNLLLRVISDIGANGSLSFNTNLVVAGVISLESQRSDRTTVLNLRGFELLNRGRILVLATNGGERVIVGALRNQGRVEVEQGIGLAIDNAKSTLRQELGAIEVGGKLAIQGGAAEFRNGRVTGDVALFNASTLVAETMTSPATLRLLGPQSVLNGNLSSNATLVLDTDVGSFTTLTTAPGTANQGRIVLSSSRSDRNSRLEVGTGFTNRPSAIIETAAGQGGGRSINGLLVNQGMLAATVYPLNFTGTYQSDGGAVTGEVSFIDARIVPTRVTPEPVELRLFGANSVLGADNLDNLVLRVISDVGANAALWFETNLVNRGTIRLESLRSDRTSFLRGADGLLVNGENGVIVADADNGGGRAIAGALRNRGQIVLEQALDLGVVNNRHINSGRIDLGGMTLGAQGEAFLNAAGGSIVGSGTIRMVGGSFINAGILSPGASPGLQTVIGNFSQEDTGELRVEIASSQGPGVGHDSLVVTNGTATLVGGTLQTRLLGGYVPVADTRFRVLAASGGLSGRFARTPSLQIHETRYLQTEYLPTALDLRTLVGTNTSLPPSIAVHPAGQTVAENSAVDFAVGVNGQGPFTYQWRFNGKAIPGATNATLRLPRVLATDFGNYDVVVANAAGTTTSDTAQLAKSTSTGGTGNTLDYGDAPDGPYPTTLAHNGASQKVDPTFHLGATIDADDGTLQNATATADGADEDGVTFLDPLVQGQVVRIRVTYQRSPTQAPGRLSAWIDWNNNGSWAEAGERIISHQQLLTASTDFNVLVPANAAVGTTYARFRLYADNYPGFDGADVAQGEVEDYQVEITRTGTGGGGGGGDNQATRDFGDAPDSYQTLLASDGARHVYDQTLYLGNSVDLETNGIPHVLALGDDLNGLTDDEDGVTGSPFLVPGDPATFTIKVAGTGKVDAWFDFNRDGDFADANERVLTGESFANQSRSFTILVPDTAVPGGTFARFRLSRQGVNTWFGEAPNGEVEDYAVIIVRPKLDWGDAPENYPTQSSANGAFHTIVEDFHFGKSIDAENDGQPNGNATGDDLTPKGAADDEDGIFFTTPLVTGQTAEVEVEVSQAGVLDAWIDFGADGSWSQAADRIFTARALAAGVNTLSFTVPQSAKGGPTFARFRLSRNGLNTFTGDGGEGEVEDYRVVVEASTPNGCELGCTGKDFWLTFPGNLAPDPANPVEPRLRFTGTSGTTLTIAIPGLGTTITTNIVGTGMTVLLPAGVDLGALNDSMMNRGIHVTATAPVGLYAISQVDFTSDGFHVLPTEVLSGEYVVTAYPNTLVGVPEVSGSQFAVVATKPLTTVLITPSYETGLRLADAPYSITLTNVGDTYQLRNTNDAPADLTGTIIEADQPVAVFGGNQCGNVNSSDVFYCDYLVEQVLPNERVAAEYFTTPLATRSNGETVRIVSLRRDTEVTINGATTVTLTNRGDVFETVLSTAAHIVATKPVHVSQFASSSDFDDVDNADPFMVNLPGRPHFTATHSFATGGTNFLTHHVTVVVPTAVTSMTLDGAAISPSFTAIGVSGFKYAHLTVAQGIHTLSAGADFGAIVYGWSLYESYGWPSCMFFGDTTPPRLSTTTNQVTIRLGDFGNDVPCKTRVPDFRQFVTVRDNCGLPEVVLITQDPEPGTLVGVGSHDLTFSATDKRGNVGTVTVTLNVVDPAPGTQVSLTCPRDFTVKCDDATGAIVTYSVEALVGCTPIAVTCTPPSGSRFPIGTTTVTCRISEPGVPVQECSFNVTVDCQKQRAVRIKPPVRPAATPDNPNPAAEIEVNWDPETTVILEAADDLNGPWIQVPTTGTGKHVIKILKERGKFFRLRG